MSRLALLLAFAGLATLPTATVSAQSDYGSIYSRFALGQRADGSSSQADAMGVSGVAIRSGLYNGLSNPAHGADQSLATFSASGTVRGIRATDANDTMSEATAGGIEFLQFGIPLYANRLGATLSYRPYSRVNYRAAEEGMVDLDGGDPVEFRSNLEGNGGLQRISLGLGGKVGEVLTVGASADALLGTVEYLRRTEFPSASDAFLETREAQSTRMYGFTGTVGATATFRRLAAENDGLTLAAAVTLPATLRGSRATTLGTSLNRDTLSTQSDGDITLPLLARAGVAYRASNRFLASADAVYEPWSDFESDFPFGGYNPTSSTTNATLEDRLRIGGGLEWTPGGGRRGASYIQQISYRLGAYVEDGFIRADDQTLLTRALTGGLSLPTRLSNARLDLGFEVGTRGEASGILVRDLFWRGTLTLNFGERWFVRRRLG
ncbi:MAG: hypothetical protein AAGI52_12665 [Bacteroidota bacterium]